MVLTVVVMRHAKAEEGQYEDDTLIPITDEAREQAKQAAKFLSSKGIKADLILASNLMRAKQTAHAMADEFKCPVQKDFCLNPDSYDVERVVSKIPDPQGLYGKDRAVIVVGHDPSVADLVNQLTGKKHMKTGMGKLGAAFVTFEDEVALGKGTFEGYHPPEETLKK